MTTKKWELESIRNKNIQNVKKTLEKMQKKSEKNGESHFYSNRIYTGSNIRKKNTCRQVDLAKWSSEMGSITEKTILYSQIWREDTEALCSS